MTYDAVPLVPRTVLFGNPTYASPAISPDGTRLGYIAPDEGVLNVWVGPLDEGPDGARPVTRDRGRGIRMYGFCHDGRTLFYLQDTDGDENWRLYLLDLEAALASEPSADPAAGERSARCVTPFDKVQVQIIGHNRWNPTTMLLGLNKDNPELHDLWRLDLATDELVKVRENPGLAGWFVDTDLTVRGGMAMTEDGGSTLFLADAAGALAPWKQIPQIDASSTGVVGFTRDGSRMYLASSVDANACRLIAVDVTADGAGAEAEIAADQAYDVGGVELDPATRVVQAVTFEKDRAEWVFLDAGLEAAVGELRGALAAAGAPDGELGIGRTELTDRRWLVTVMPSDGPIHYYVYDRDADPATALRFLFVHKPDLSAYTLAPMEPFGFTARDGLEVHGYLTVPVGVERHGLPAVLEVHGGPEARDSWGYDANAQWLANRGYVCVQVNFRGSSGYGKAFTSAGDKRWGREMHTDLLDAVDHLAGLGLIDPARVGISGGSYGGYAALAGAAFSPEVFRCAIDLCGPSNLLTLLASIPAYWKPVAAYLYARVGNPETDKDRLWAQSPLSRVEDIRIPVLVAQGANDPRVKEAEAQQIVDALASKGIPHEYLLFPDEGHGLARPENRLRFYTATEAFLADHLGGRSEDATASASADADETAGAAGDAGDAGDATAG